MLVAIAAQKPLPMGGLSGDDVHIWDSELKIIDKILADSEFIAVLWESVRRMNPRAKATGRKRMALNRLLRAALLKHIKTWSFPGLYKELQRNLDYRAFTQYFDDKIPSVATFSRNLACVDAQAVRELNELVLVFAQKRGVIQGRNYRQDTTVCETNIHYPTDSSLLQDGVRVLQRLAGNAAQLVSSIKGIRNRSAAVSHRKQEIRRSARQRGNAAKARRENSYRSLLRIARRVATDAGRIAKKLSDGRVIRHLDWADELCAKAIADEFDTVLSRFERVIRQTRARICQGINNYPDKLLSMFVPKTWVIRKGKAHKPNEFGRLVDIVEVENGIVSDYQVLDGNPDDGSLLIPALERHQTRFGRVPYLVATDRGFYSGKNIRQAEEMGVKRVAIPARGKLSQARLRIQRSRWFRNGQRWRAAGEGRIGTLKNFFGMNRCMYKDIAGTDDDAMKRWVGWCVLANNLVFVARALQEMGQDVEIDTTSRQSNREAA